MGANQKISLLPNPPNKMLVFQSSENPPKTNLQICKSINFHRKSSSQICRFSQSATSWRETGLGRGPATKQRSPFLPTDPTFTAAAHAILVDAAAAAVIAAVTLLVALLQCCFWCSCCSASGNFNSFRPFPDGNLATESGPKLVFGTISDPANGTVEQDR